MVSLDVRKRVVLAVVVALGGLNLVAYRQARAFTHFAPAGHRTPPPDRLAWTQKIRVLARGVEVPRPENQHTPRDHGFAFERHVFAGAFRLPLEAWYIPRPDARATVVLFHGHAASKDSLLREAKVFRSLGLNVLLVDFYGSGGSGGSETSIGFHEATDVAKAYAYARELPGRHPVVLYGVSMGASATLKAVGDGGLEPAALILECPFDSLLGTVRHRFTSYGLPSFPLADMLVYWGGRQQGFDARRFNPSESAARIDRPTLLMNGEADPWVQPDEARAIFERLQGRKTLKLFEGVGHDSCLRSRPDEWKRIVSGFLDETLGVPAARAQ